MTQSHQSITPLLHHSIAKSVYDDIKTRRAHYYHVLANTTPWEDVLGFPIYNHSHRDEIQLRSDIISGKKIEIGDVAYMVENINWVYGTVYTMYDDNTDISGKNFYVIIESNIYKCLNNNYGAASTEIPYGQETFKLELSDGYVWKFMGTIPVGFMNRFAGTGYVPISNAVYNKYYADGSILSENIIIQNGGLNYDDEARLQVEGDGLDGSGEHTAKFDYPFLDENGSVSAPTYDSSGAIIDPSSIVLLDGGEGYTFMNLKVVTGANDPGEGADIEVRVGNYGNLDTKQALVEKTAVPGSLSAVVIENPGSNYSTTEGVVTAVITGDGNKAVVQLTITEGSITEAFIPIATVWDPDYTSYIVGDIVEYGIETTTVDPLDSSLYLWEWHTYKCSSIPPIGIDEQYSNPIFDNVSWEELFSGVNYGIGEGYHNISIDIVDDSAFPGVDGVVRPILSSRGGHGSDLPRELFAHVLCFFTTLEDDENLGITVLNEYNQVGLIKNISKFGNSGLYTSALGTTLYKVTTYTPTIVLSSINVNTILYSGGSRYKIISYNLDKSEILLQTINHDNPPTQSGFYIDVLETVLAFDGMHPIVPPSIDRYSGDIIFAENRATFSVSGEFADSDQGVKFKTFISF